MKYVITPIIGLLLALVSFVVAPVGMLFAVWFVKWDAVPTTGSYDIAPTIRGDLPWWLSWFSTPDERCPGNAWEPTIDAMLKKYGKSVTTYYNLGLRNQLMGLAAALGKPTSDYIPEVPVGFWCRDDVWRYSLALGPVKFVFGWQVYKRLSGSFLAVPVCTLKTS